jgi:multiple sugar transport system permease protein
LWGIFINVILPLSKPGLATLTTFTFMGSWGNFMWPMIVTNSEEIKTLPIGLLSFQGMYNTDWTLLMAGSLIVLIPVIIVFLLGQRHFVEGIQMGAIKG